jgi:hypothetical protein
MIVLSEISDFSPNYIAFLKRSIASYLTSNGCDITKFETGVKNGTSYVHFEVSGSFLPDSESYSSSEYEALVKDCSRDWESFIDQLNFDSEKEFAMNLQTDDIPDGDCTIYIKPIMNEISEETMMYGVLETSIDNAPNVMPHYHYYYLDSNGNGWSGAPNCGHSHKHQIINQKIGEILEDSDHSHKIGVPKISGDDTNGDPRGRMPVITQTEAKRIFGNPIHEIFKKK